MLLALLSLCWMQAPPEAAPSLTVSRAQAWLTTVYPVLRRGDVNVVIYGDGVTARLVVTAQTAYRTPGDTAVAPVLLVADVHRSKVTGRLEALQARGLLVQSDKQAALATAIVAHPAWALSDVATAITAAGGRFPPGARSELLAQLPALADLFGGPAAFQQATFVATDARGPMWLIDAIVGARSVRISIEPFGGNVIGLVAR